MKRDMDLIREMLIAIEQDPRYNATDLFAYNNPSDVGIEGRTSEEVGYHLQMMIDYGLVKGKRSPISPIFGGLTMEGHDFLDAIRDPEIWKQTKDVAGRAGGFSLEILGDLAKGLLKTQIEKYTGVKL